jgi:hypothetical protein
MNHSTTRAGRNLGEALGPNGVDQGRGALERGRSVRRVIAEQANAIYCEGRVLNYSWYIRAFLADIEVMSFPAYGYDIKVRHRGKFGNDGSPNHARTAENYRPLHLPSLRRMRGSGGA